MKVFLDKKLFSDPDVDTSVLLEIIWEAEYGRHLVFVEGSDDLVDDWLDSTVNNWLGELDSDSEERAIFALQESYVSASTSEPTAEIRVTTTGDDWDSLALSPVTTRDFLRRPLNVWFENDINDSSFLTSCCSPELSESLTLLVSKGWVVFCNAGGISSMPERANNTTTESRWKTMFLFDSDSLIPDVRGNDSNRVALACEENALKYHCLERRAIENYIPPKTLRTWAYRTTFRGQERRRLRLASDAYKRMNSEQRNYYGVKSGFAGDKNLIASQHWLPYQQHISALYESVDEGDRKDLGSGFQKSVASQIYGETSIPYGYIVEDGVGEEINDVALMIINGV